MYGGRRNGAGRPKGALNVRTRIMLEEAMAGGEMPIAYMLRVMRDENAPDARRDEMAKAAASYLHSKQSLVRDEDEEAYAEPAAAAGGAESGHADA